MDRPFPPCRPARRLLPVAALGLMLAAAPALAQSLAASAGEVEITRLAAGLEEPWSIGFLPDGGVLVTERAGRLRHYAPGALPGGEGRPVEGVPEVHARGQGGLFDVLVPRDFAETREILLSFAMPQGGGGAGTALGAGRLSQDGTRLEDFRILWQMAEGTSGGRHFGGRLVEAGDGTIFLTLGDRGAGPRAQDPAAPNGKVVRLTREGAPAPDNPDPSGPLPELWSLGHRNPQGAALDAQGRLWLSEHGARGGDEVNRVEPGRNYGWPVISYGVDYDGSPLGEGTEKAGMEQPAHYWDPSIAPSGHVIYSGRLWPDWAGDHFVGSLKFDYIARLDPESGWEEEALRDAATARVRDVREAPDGALWFLSVGNGALYRIAPPGR